MTSPDDAPAREPEAAAARPKRDTHRIVYSPELLAELRHLYERTPETCDNIALRRGISRPTLRSLAKRQGWVRFQRRPLDLSPAVRLEARLAAAERRRAPPSEPAFPLPPRAFASGGEGSGLGGSFANREAAPPTPNPSPPFAAQMGGGEHVLTGGGERALTEGGEQAAVPPANCNSAETAQSAPAKTAAAPDTANSFEETFRLTAAAALEETQAQIDALKAARLQLEETGRFEKFSQLGRDLAAITNSLYRIKRMHGGATQDLLPDDDMLSDLDARRDALARRIDAILAQWMDAQARGHVG